MNANKIIVGGDLRNEEAILEWLQAHGARIETCLGLTLAELPARAQVHQEIGATRWHVTVGFYDASGNDEDTYLNCEVSEDDAQETTWALITEK